MTVTSTRREGGSPDGARYSIAAASRALALLGALAEQDVVRLDDAAQLLAVSKSTAYRLLATLETSGLAERLPEGGYRAGPGAVRWASQLLAGLDIRTGAAPFLRALRDEFRETVNLAVLRGASIVYVDILESPSAFRMADVPGSLAPAHATALGKAIATRLEPTRLAALLGPEPYHRYTADTATTWEELAPRIDEARVRGYAVDREEVATGVVCVGAPVMVRWIVGGAVSVSAPRARMDDDRLALVGERLVRVTETLSERLSP